MAGQAQSILEDDNFEWVEEASTAIDLCSDWSKKVSRSLKSKVYLFGSVIYDRGDQFDSLLSDLDIVVIFSDTLDVTERSKRLVDLKKLKLQLELSLIPGLHRDNCTDPSVSILPLMELEVTTNIHKSGSRRFFDKNIFWDLEDKKLRVSLPDAGTSAVPDERRQALEYVQKVRNEFLSVSANDTGGLDSFDKLDPVPKPLARVAAQLVKNAKIGEWYDTRLGLEYLYSELGRRQYESEELGHLYSKLSKRRGGKGRRRPLTDFDQLLLTELVYDCAVAYTPDRIVEWEIVFLGQNISDLDLEEIQNDLAIFAIDSTLLEKNDNEILIKVRSSRRNFGALKRLFDAGGLNALFGVKRAIISGTQEYEDRYKSIPLRPLDVIANKIKEWHSSSQESMHLTEVEFVRWLHNFILTDSSLSEFRLAREVLIDGGNRPYRVDILLIDPKLPNEKPIAIEIARARNRLVFFSNLEKSLQFLMPTILVILISAKLLGKVADDIERFLSLNENIRIVTIIEE